MRRREKRRKKEVEASFKSSVLCVWKICNDIFKINIVVAELKNTDFRWSKRDGPLWAVPILKKKFAPLANF
jgi:hypothetical protein